MSLGSCLGSPPLPAQLAATWPPPSCMRVCILTGWDPSRPTPLHTSLICLLTHQQPPCGAVWRLALRMPSTVALCPADTPMHAIHACVLPACMRAHARDVSSTPPGAQPGRGPLGLQTPPRMRATLTHKHVFSVTMHPVISQPAHGLQAAASRGPNTITSHGARLGPCFSPSSLRSAPTRTLSFDLVCVCMTLAGTDTGNRAATGG